MGTLDEGLATWTGVATRTSELVSYGLLPGFVTPDGALDHMRQVDVQASALERDVTAAKTAAKPISATFVDTWTQWLTNWRAFVSTNEAWLPRFLAPAEIDSQTTRYEAQLRDFYTRFRSEGSQTTMTPPLPQGAGDPLAQALGGSGAGKGVGSQVQTAFLIAATIAGLAATGYLIHAVRAKSV